MIAEQGGATDAQTGGENILKLMTEIAREEFRAKTPRAARIAEDRKKVPALQAAMKDPALDMDIKANLATELGGLEEEIAKYDQELNDYVKERVAVTLDAFTEGKESGRKKIIETSEKNRGLFEKGDAARGIAPVSPFFRPMLDEASADAIRAKDLEQVHIQHQQGLARLGEDLKRKNEQEFNEAAQRTHDDLTDKARDAMAARIEPGGLEGVATGRLRDLRKGGMDPERAFDAVRAEVLKDLGDVLGVNRLATHGAHEAAEGLARQVAGKAQTAVEGELGKAASAIKTAHERAVAGHVQDLSRAFAQEAGPKSLDATVRRHLRKGEDDAAIRAALAAEMDRRVAGAGVPEGQRADVAGRLFEDALGRGRAEMVAGDPGRHAARDARAERADQQHAPAEQIFAASPEAVGMQFSPKQATAAAHRAQQALTQVFNENQAAMMGMMSVMEGLERFGQQVAQQSAMMQMGMGRMGGARQMQPSLMPVFRGAGERVSIGAASRRPRPRRPAGLVGLAFRPSPAVCNQVAEDYGQAAGYQYEQVDSLPPEVALGMQAVAEPEPEPDSGEHTAPV